MWKIRSTYEVGGNAQSFYFTYVAKKSAANVTIYSDSSLATFEVISSSLYARSLYDARHHRKHYENFLRIIRFTAELSSDRSERFYGSLVTERLANIFSFIPSVFTQRRKERQAEPAASGEGEERMKRRSEAI